MELSPVQPLFLQGFFGVHPYAVARFFTDRGYDVKVSFGNFEDTAKAYETNIMYYDKPQMGHYVAIQYKDGIFNGYNTFSSNSKGCDYSGEIITRLEKNEKTYIGKVLISIFSNN